MSIYVPPCKPAQQVGPEFAVAETLMVLVTGANATARGAFSGSAGKLSHRQWIATRTFRYIRKYLGMQNDMRVWNDYSVRSYAMLVAMYLFQCSCKPQA